MGGGRIERDRLPYVTTDVFLASNDIDRVILRSGQHARDLVVPFTASRLIFKQVEGDDAKSSIDDAFWGLDVEAVSFGARDGNHDAWFRIFISVIVVDQDAEVASESAVKKEMSTGDCSIGR